MRNTGCEDCEAQVTTLTRARAVTVRQREKLWRAINLECELACCPRQCSLRGLVSRISGNLSSFVGALDRHEDSHIPETAAIETVASM